jgi:hypothetical protein
LDGHPPGTICIKKIVSHPATACKPKPPSIPLPSVQGPKVNPNIEHRTGAAHLPLSRG